MHDNLGTETVQVMPSSDTERQDTEISTSHPFADAHTHREASDASFDSLIVVPCDESRIWRLVEARETVGCERLAVQPEVFRSLRDEVVHV
jgi:hypothetical protein